MFFVFLPWKILPQTQFQHGNWQNVKIVIAVMRVIAIVIAQDGQHDWAELSAYAGPAH